MVPEGSDDVAMKAQADMDRLLKTLIFPSLTQFSPDESSYANLPEEERAWRTNPITYTSNQPCYEIRRPFALLIFALF